MKVIKHGKAYDGQDAVITALGQIWEEVTEVSYGTEVEHQANHTVGSRKATSWSMGKESNEGSITMMMNQSVALEKACGGRLVDIKPFPINITFVDDYNEIVNDTIIAKFTGQGRQVNTEMGLQRQYTLFVVDVDLNNVR